ncbi:GtrA family protein [Blastococcus deserti]|uniref:GtrA family protein n=1 Tax=Blastococcus deserti TaxID=2259033 RepID=A0ABW4X745_9ACTN
MSTPRRKRLGVFARFVLVNALNTGLYWGLYLALLPVAPYMVANGIALAVAVLVAYVANARYAFRVGTSRWSLVMYLVTNGTTVVLRSAVVWVLVEVLSLSEVLAPPVAVVVTMPVAFGLTRWAMRERVGAPQSASSRPAAEVPAAELAHAVGGPGSGCR